MQMLGHDDTRESIMKESDVCANHRVQQMQQWQLHSELFCVALSNIVIPNVMSLNSEWLLGKFQIKCYLPAKSPKYFVLICETESDSRFR